MKHYEFNECTCLTELVYYFYGSEAKAKEVVDFKERCDYLKSIDCTFVPHKIIDEDLIFGAVDDIVGLKNTYHDFVNRFGWKAAEMIRKDSWFGKAYYNALVFASNGYGKQIQLPPAKMIFEELKKLLTRASYHGFIIDNESVKKYM